MSITKKIIFGEWRTEIAQFEDAYVVITKGHQGLLDLLKFKVSPRLSYWGRDGRRAVHDRYIRYDQYHRWEPISEVLRSQNYLFENKTEAETFLSKSCEQHSQRTSRLTDLYSGSTAAKGTNL